MLAKTVVQFESLIKCNWLLATPTPISKAGNDITRRSGGWLEMVGLVFILIMILFAAYYTSKFLGKYTMGQMKNSNFHVIDTYRISPNKFLQIVKIANKYIVISVSKDIVSFITELDESEVFIREANVQDNLSFKQIFEKLKNKVE